MTVRILFFMLIGTFVYSSLTAQNTVGLPQIINYQKTDYGGGTQTWNITQGKDGRMYFANNEGLLTFDGTYWQNYTIPNRTIVRSIAINEQGKIFIGAQDEIGYFEADQSGRLLYTSLKPLIPASYNSFADIWQIVVYQNSVFFQASDRIFQLDDQVINVYTPRVEWQFMGLAGNKLLAQDKQSGLFEFNGKHWQPIAGTTILNNTMITGFIKKPDAGIVITTKRSGLFQLKDGLVTKPQLLNTSNFESITSSGMINNREFVAGTTSEGCIIGDFQGKTIQSFSTKEGLQNNHVLSVFTDRDENLWLGLNNGISFIGYNSPIKYISPNTENEISGYGAIVHNSHLYIATANGAYQAPLPTNEEDISFVKSAISLIKHTDGEVWKADIVNNHVVFGHNDGIFELEKNMTAMPLAKETGCWLFRPLQYVLPARQVLVGAYTGLQLLNFENGRFLNATLLKGLHESFRFIEVDNYEQIWASHPYRGIYQIVISSDKKSYTTKLFTEKDGLPATLENYVFKVGNQVVFATSAGIYEYDRKRKKFKPADGLQKVFGTTPIRYLKEDGEGNLWFCSEKRIGVAVRAGNAAGNNFTIRYIPELTGQILSGFENIYPYNRENIFIASEKGIIHLNYRKYENQRRGLSVLMKEIRAIGKTDSLLWGGYSRKTSPGKTILPATFNSFHFAFSSPNFGMQKSTLYSYKLEGYDKDWSSWSEKTEKDYTNLAAGNYTFRVKAKNSMGEESQSRSYNFYVSPYWYETTFARLFYILAGIGLCLLFYRQHKRKLDKQRIRYEEEQRRLKELHQLKIEKNEKEIIKLQNEKLANEVKYKNRELAEANLHLEERSGALAKVKGELEVLYRKTGQNRDIKRALQLLNEFEKNNTNWDQFVAHFDDVNNDYFKKLKLKYPALSRTDLKLCAYLQLNLTSKEIAQMMNISVRGVEIARYRLRKKLEIESGTNLNEYLNGYLN